MWNVDSPNCTYRLAAMITRTHVSLFSFTEKRQGKEFPFSTRNLRQLRYKIYDAAMSVTDDMLDALPTRSAVNKGCASSYNIVKFIAECLELNLNLLCNDYKYCTACRKY